MVQKDFYQLLNVERRVSQSELRKSYRRLARKYHPDVNPGDKSAEDRFKEIQEAHSVLGDPEQRQQYDQFGTTFKQAGGSSAGQFNWPGTRTSRRHSVPGWKMLQQSPGCNRWLRRIPYWEG